MSEGSDIKANEADEADQRKAAATNAAGATDATDATDASDEADDTKEPRLKRIPVIGPALSLYRGYSQRNGPLLSAGIAYYGLFALAPLMFLTVQVVGSVVGTPTAQTEIRGALETYLGEKLADIISGIVLNSSVPTYASATSTIIGGAVLLYAAARLFLRLKAAFDVMWDVRARREKVWWKRLLYQIATLAMILAPALLLLTSLILNGWISWLEDLLGTSGWLLATVQAVAPFLIGWWSLIAIFTILPDVRISWRDAWLGALCTAILWSLGARVFGLYLSWSTSQKYAGAIGAFLVAIVWANFMAIVALLSIRLNKLLYERRVARAQDQ